MLEVMARSSSSMSSPPPQPDKKRKRLQEDVEELEVDITAPEPPSKKALRKAKKAKTVSSELQPKHGEKVEAPNDESEEHEASRSVKSTQYGIWIGNLPWSASKADLRAFLTSDTNIPDDAIARIHMPAPKDATASSRSSAKPQNKGFAYIDFTTEVALREALTLSETLLTGRRVLIKDARSFEGRPEKLEDKQEAANTYSGKPPSKRIFVGNLDFDTTKEGLKDHFLRCGEVQDVHIATFEDSGKCKGYGWVEFNTVGAGQAAVRGWVDFEREGEHSKGESESDHEEQKLKLRKKPKVRKWWVNRLYGRPLKLEFAEAKDVRYKKRFGKSAGTQQKTELGDQEASTGALKINVASRNGPPGGNVARPQNLNQHRPEYQQLTKKKDARLIAPSVAHAAAPRLQASIVASEGKKIVFA